MKAQMSGQNTFMRFHNRRHSWSDGGSVGGMTLLCGRRGNVVDFGRVFIED